MNLHRRLLRRLIPPRLLNRVNHLTHLEDRLFQLEARIARLAEISFRDRYANLFANPPGAEFRLYSQNGEDGILLWLLEATGAPVKKFVEIGCGNARECNTALLAFVFGWDGLMLDADPLNEAAARALAGEMLAGGTNRVEVRRVFVTRGVVNALVGAEELGVLSIDVDGVDYWLWEAVEDARPRIVIVEYNASLGAGRSITVPYRDNFSAADEHPSRYYHGASLAAMEKLGRRKGYSLVAVDAAGVNAFFVREDIRPPALPARRAEELFRPHWMRSRAHSPEEQWALIRHLPYEEV